MCVRGELFVFLALATSVSGIPEAVSMVMCGSGGADEGCAVNGAGIMPNSGRWPDAVTDAALAGDSMRLIGELGGFEYEDGRIQREVNGFLELARTLASAESRVSVPVDEWKRCVPYPYPDCPDSHAAVFIIWVADGLKRMPPSENRIAAQDRLLSFITEELRSLDEMVTDYVALVLVKASVFHDEALVIPAYPVEKLTSVVAGHGRHEDKRVRAVVVDLLGRVACADADKAAGVFQAADKHLDEQDSEVVKAFFRRFHARYKGISERDYLAMEAQAPADLVTNLSDQEPERAVCALAVLNRRRGESAVFNALGDALDKGEHAQSLLAAVASLLDPRVLVSDSEDKKRLALAFIEWCEDRLDEGKARVVPVRPLEQMLVGGVDAVARADWHALPEPWMKQQVIDVLIALLVTDDTAASSAAADALGKAAWLDSATATRVRNALVERLGVLMSAIESDCSEMNSPKRVAMHSLKTTIEDAVAECDRASESLKAG